MEDKMSISEDLLQMLKEKFTSLDEEKLLCPTCKNVQLVRNPKNGKYVCAKCQKSFDKVPKLTKEDKEI
jgi:ribosomal protein L37AE/L43A